MTQTVQIPFAESILFPEMADNKRLTRGAVKSRTGPRTAAQHSFPRAKIEQGFDAPAVAREARLGSHFPDREHELRDRGKESDRSR